MIFSVNNNFCNIHIGHSANNAKHLDHMRLSCPTCCVPFVLEIFIASCFKNKLDVYDANGVFSLKCRENHFAIKYISARLSHNVQTGRLDCSRSSLSLYMQNGCCIYCKPDTTLPSINSLGFICCQRNYPRILLSSWWLVIGYLMFRFSNKRGKNVTPEVG